MTSPARVLQIAVALGLAACASPETTTPADAAETAPSTDFDAQAWLADARTVTVSIEEADLEDSRIDRMKQLADALDAEAGWQQACDTYIDYDTGEVVHDPIPPGGGHWARGTLEIGDISPTEAVVSVTCDYGAYQGSYAFVHVDGDRVALLSAPEVDENGEPIGVLQTAFSTPDFSSIQERRIATLAKARGLGDCGTYATYRLDAGGAFSLRQLRSRDCEDTIPDELPPPSEWPIVYTAPS